MSFNHIKIFSSVQENIPKCIKKCDVQPLADIFDAKVSESVKCCIESSVRDYVTNKICLGEKTDLNKLTNLVQVCIEAVRKELVLPVLPVLVLSDAFESLTLVQCEKLFTFVETNVAVWKEEVFHAQCKNYVLRMCNDVLRRLSRSQNTVFCGRILLFLARFFTFSERSGLNLISEFNLENVTNFTTMEPMEGTDEDEAKTDDKYQDKPALDYTFYTKFWTLQDFFRNPPQCYQKGPWKIFSTYADDVLEAFTKYKFDEEDTQSRPKRRKVEKSPTKFDPKDKSDQYFAKYLTNQKLLELQFSDSNFRRYILLQMLILFQYLTANIRFKTEALSDEQLKKLRLTEQKVYSLLAETPPDGLKFVESVKHTIEREEKWNEWKNNGCPPIKKKPVKEEEVKEEDKEKDDKEKENVPVESPKKKEPKRNLGDIVKEADAENKFTLGNQEMTRLWNLNTDNLDACRESKRDFIPAMNDYFLPAVKQITTKQKVKKRKVEDSSFGWKGLRLLACRSPYFFTHSSSIPIPEYLTQIVKKIAKEMPELEEEETPTEEDKDTSDNAAKDESADKETPMEEEEQYQDDQNERAEVIAITDAEQKDLAFNLSKLGEDKWKTLAAKLGFEKDEIEYIDQQKSSIEEKAAYAFQLWVENEGTEANKDALIYTLEGLGLAAVAKGVFN